MWSSSSPYLTLWLSFLLSRWSPWHPTDWLNQLSTWRTRSARNMNAWWTSTAAPTTSASARLVPRAPTSHMTSFPLIMSGRRRWWDTFLNTSVGAELVCLTLAHMQLIRPVLTFSISAVWSCISIDFLYVLVLFTQTNLGKKRSELKHLIKERAKKLDEIKQSIKVIKVSHLVPTLGKCPATLSFDRSFFLPLLPLSYIPCLIGFFVNS